MGLAKRLGSKHLIKDILFGHYSSNPKVLKNEINDLKCELKHAIEIANRGDSDASYWVNRVEYLKDELIKHQKWLTEALKKTKNMAK